MAKFLRRCLIYCVVAALVGVGIAEGSLRYLRHSTKGQHISKIQDLAEDYPVAIVFGASVLKNGNLSSVLQDRVDAAIDLYKQKKVKKILMTGDNGSVDYDEVSAMRKYALTKDVPSKDITLDYAGFNTYDSCYRAKEIFDVKKAVLVTQRFHQSRAIYACRYIGIDVVGLDLPDFEKYPELYTKTRSREMLASVKLLWQTHITKPQPKFLGKKEPISF